MKNKNYQIGDTVKFSGDFLSRGISPRLGGNLREYTGRVLFVRDAGEKFEVCNVEFKAPGDRRGFMQKVLSYNLRLIKRNTFYNRREYTLAFSNGARAIITGDDKDNIIENIKTMVTKGALPSEVVALCEYFVFECVPQIKAGASLEFARDSDGSYTWLQVADSPSDHLQATLVRKV